jgi:hypothetical protein
MVGPSERTVCNRNAIQNYIPHDEPKHMVGITGDQLEILGEGEIGTLSENVYYAPSADLSVISVEDLQNKGLKPYFCRFLVVAFIFQLPLLFLTLFSSISFTCCNLKSVI